jgi:hypothetical protein
MRQKRFAANKHRETATQPGEKAMGKFLRYFIGCALLLVSGLAIAAGFNMRIPIYGVPAPPAVLAGSGSTSLTATLTCPAGGCATKWGGWGQYTFVPVSDYGSGAKLTIQGGVKPYAVKWVVTAYQAWTGQVPWIPMDQSVSDGTSLQYDTLLFGYPGWAPPASNEYCADSNFGASPIVSWQAPQYPGDPPLPTQEAPDVEAIQYGPPGTLSTITCAYSDGNGSSFKLHAVVTDSAGASVTTATIQLDSPGY